MKNSSVPLALLCSLALASSGCSVFGNKSKNTSNKNWSISKLWHKEYQKPNTLSVIWSPDVLTLTGKPPTRGFGGRVFFYNDRTQAIPVEGDLIVHGYQGDPMLGESQQVRADKTFRFTAEQLTGHFSPSELGASYSVWIPWDAAGGLRQEITLIPTFQGVDGQIVQGAPAKLYLPGRSIDSVAKHDAGDKSSAYGFETQTVSYQQRSIPTNASGKLPHIERQTEPTTIELPALASLGRPRTQTSTPATGFLLGSAGRSQSPTAPTAMPASGAQPPNAPLPSAQLPNAPLPSAQLPSTQLPSANSVTPLDEPPPTSERPPTGSGLPTPAASPAASLPSSMTPTAHRLGKPSGPIFSIKPWNSAQ